MRREAAYKLGVLEAKKDGGMQEGYEGRKERCQRSRVVFSLRTLNGGGIERECGEEEWDEIWVVACIVHYSYM